MTGPSSPPPTSAPDNNNNNTIFVQLPDKQTLAVRRLPDSLSVESLKARVEVQTGLLSSCFRLRYGEVLLDDCQDIDLGAAGSTVRRGGVVRVTLADDALTNIYECVTQRKVRRLVKLCQSLDDRGNSGNVNNTDEDVNTRNSATADESDKDSPKEGDEHNSSETVSDNSARTRITHRDFAVFLASALGYYDILEALTATSDPSRLFDLPQTLCGRTLAHVAAASDQIQVLTLLIRNGEGASLHTPDQFGRTPLDEAVASGSYTCERLLRQSLKEQIDSKGAKHSKKKRRSGSKSAPARTVCWEDSPRGQTARTTVVGAMTVSGGDTVRGHSAKVSRDLSVISERRGRSAVADNFSNMTFTGTALMSRKLHSARSRSSVSPSSARHSVPTIPPGSNNKENQFPGDKSSPRAVNPNHKECTSRPPFVAFRSVAEEELRPVAVEYVPLEGSVKSQTFDLVKQHERLAAVSCPSAPHCSPTSSTEDLRKAGGGATGTDATGNADADDHDADDDDDDDKSVSEKYRILQKREEMRRRYSRVRNTSLRAQSAKYYKTKYHKRADDGIPKARPATAGPRYREWKTWLLDKMEESEQKALDKELNREHDEQNARAFKHWLRRKQRQQELADEYDNASSDGDSDDFDGILRPPKLHTDNQDPNERAYQKWLAKKKHVFEAMDEARQKQQSGEVQQQPRKDRKVTIFELGVHSDKPSPRPRADDYMHAYQSWHDTRKRYEKWKKRKGLDDSAAKKEWSAKDLAEMRGALMLDGMTYHEWLGLKEREHKTARLQVHNIGTKEQITNVKPKSK